MSVCVRVSDAKTIGNWEIERHSLLGTMVCYVDLARNGTFPGHFGLLRGLSEKWDFSWPLWFVMWT